MAKVESAQEIGLEREVYNLLFQHFEVERRNWSAACHEFGLTLMQAHLLRRLTPAAPMKMNGLAEALDCDPSHVTGLVDKLEARALIERQPEPGDRRVKMITLTKAGIKFQARLLERLSQPSPAVTSLSLEDKKTLRRIVKQMVDRAGEERINATSTGRLSRRM